MSLGKALGTTLMFCSVILYNDYGDSPVINCAPGNIGGGGLVRMSLAFWFPSRPLSGRCDIGIRIRADQSTAEMWNPKVRLIETESRMAMADAGWRGKRGLLATGTSFKL